MSYSDLTTREKSLVRRTLVSLLFPILLLLLVNTALAQTEITVLDSEDGSPLTGVHVRYSDIKSGKKEYTTTNTHGVAHIPAAFISSHPKYTIFLTYIGYEHVSDTLSGIQTRTYPMQQSAISMNEIVVTGQYAPGAAEHSIVPVRVIAKEQLEQMGAVTLNDALKVESNMRLSQDNVLGSSLSIQGLSGENIKILVDGVPIIGRMNGNIDLSQIILHDVERIEIVEGPLSVRYGTNALAGTINLITSAPEKPGQSVSVTSHVENIGTYNLSGTVSTGWDHHSLQITGGRNYFDGWSRGDAFFPSFEKLRADSSRYKQWKPREQYFARLLYNAHFDPVTIRYKGEFFDETITNRGLPQAPYYEKAFDDIYATQRIDNTLLFAGKLFSSASFNAHISHNLYERVSNTYTRDLTTLTKTLTAASGEQDTSKFQQWSSQGTVTALSASHAFDWELGYDIIYEKGIGQRIESGEKTQSDYALFATAEIRPFANFTLKPGVRAAYNTEYDAPIVPSINAIYIWNEVRIRAGAAMGFRAPSLKELYFSFFDINHNITGNSDLKAEESMNYSLAFSHKYCSPTAILKSELSLYYNDIRNLISLAQTDGDIYSYVNIGVYRTHGFMLKETLFRGSYTVAASASLTGQYNELSESTDVSVYSYTPMLGVQATKSFADIGLSLGLYYSYQGAQKGYALSGESSVITTSIDPYHLADITITKDIIQNMFSMTLGVKNIFDVQNVSATQSSGVHSAGSSSVSIATGISVFLDMTFHHVL